MSRGKFRRPPLRTLAVVASGVWVLSFPAMGQEGPGDQKLSFGVSQKFQANDNIRLDDTSVGTTYSSDTKLSFGFNSQTRSQTLEFTLDGVLRLVNDPLIGTESGFRDPSMALFYSRENLNNRLTLTADYKRPDLAFLDPLTQGEISDQDLFRGGGTREEYLLGVRLETGLSAPLGFVFDLNSRGRRFSDTTDPLLFANRTDTAAVAALFQFSPVTQGRLDLSDETYTAKDTLRTNRTTRRFTFGLDHEFSQITSLSATIGHSEVDENFDTLPVRTVTRGPIGSLAVTRLTANGSLRASFDTSLSTAGRQSTLEFARIIELAAGGLEFSFGATTGDGFDLLPIAGIAYTTDLPTGSLTASASRVVSVSDTLSRTETTTRVDFGYAFDINDISSLSFDMYYADISLTGTGAGGGPGRERASFYATYTRDITEYWDFKAGYEYRYFNSSTTSPARSNVVFLSLQRDFEVFR